MEQQFDIFVTSLRSFMTDFGLFLPKLIGAVAILIVGWLVAKLLQFVVVRGLKGISFHKLTLLFFYMGSNIIYRYNLTTKEAIPVTVNTINDSAFAVGAKDIAYLASPALEHPQTGSVLKSHIVSLKANGTKEDLSELTFSSIESADVDNENRLCIYADGGLRRIELDGTITSV